LQIDKKIHLNFSYFISYWEGEYIQMEKVNITSDSIQLDQFLKWANIVESGGKAKLLIQEGNIRVNGKIEERRSTKLKPGDLVSINGTDEKFEVVKENSQ